MKIFISGVWDRLWSTVFSVSVVSKLLDYLFALVHDTRGRMHWLIFMSQTSATRVWFGLSSLGYSYFFMFAHGIDRIDSGYELMLQILPNYIWAGLLAVHGLSLLYGVISRTYNKALLLLECTLGVVLWVSITVCMVMLQGSLGPSIVGGLVSVWLYIRYPTVMEPSEYD